MEDRYSEPGEERFVTENIDFNEYFNDYGKLVYSTFPILSRSSPPAISDFVAMSDAELMRMDRLTKLLIPPEAPENEDVEPNDEDEDKLADLNLPAPAGFKKRFFQDPPKAAVDALRALKSANTCDKRKLSYVGEIDVSDLIIERRDTYQQVSDLVPYGFYVLTVRVHFPVDHSKHTNLTRAKLLQVSQEFMCCSCTGLDSFRDRIACTNDFQPVDGDISANHLRLNPTRASEIHCSGMFYIGNNFYNDNRRPDNVNYSDAIIKWGRKEGYEFGEVLKMEDCTFGDIRRIRLGYPYLYRHLATCEHIIIFTDARLFHPTDPVDSSKYPFMKSFASLNGRYCFTCHVRIAKYLVTNNPRLPEETAFMCQACFESFNYKSGQKIGSFKAYGYVDRTALL